ncbi:sodium/hydrogen exchanger 9B2 isoform X2 [Anabrus simplex]
MTSSLNEATRKQLTPVTEEDYGTYINAAFDAAKEEIGVQDPRVTEQDGKSASWWRRLSAHPWVPSWRRISRAMAVLLGALAIWGVAVSVAGDTATPGGQLFSVVVLCVVAHFAGKLMQLISLPPLLGMLLAGVTLRNVGFVHLSSDYLHVAAILRKMALSVILIRAGLGLDPVALRRLSLLVLRLAALPSLVEAAALTVITHLLLGMPWIWGLLLGSVMAAVSPAVVIPCLFRLQAKGYGTDKGIPTLVIAAASLDDVIAVTAFGIVLSIIFSSGSLTMKIIQGPLTILIGVAFGIIWGAFARVVPQKLDTHVSELRTLVVGGGGFLAVLGSDAIGFDGAGPLGCILAAFVACQAWRQQGWSDSQNPVADHFRVVWLVFQTLLFALIGTEIDLMILKPTDVALGAACLIIALSCRIFISVVVAFGGNLTWKEKLFVSLAWFPKATVQAALGPVALDMVRTLGRQEEAHVASQVLTLSVMAILLTAPAGAALITLLGTRLLTKDSASTSPAVERPAQTSG